MARGLGAVAAALVRLHAATDGLGRNAGADFNVRLFDADARFNGPAAASAEGGRKHPLSVGVCKLVDGNDTNTRRVVAAVSWTEANAPSSLRIGVSLLLIS